MRKTLSSLLLLSICFLGTGQNKQSSPDELAKLYPTKDIVSRYHNNWTQRHYKDRIKVFKREPLTQNEIVFIGNSITEQGGDWSEKFNTGDIRNRGIAGDVTDGVLKRLDEITWSHPKAVFILIGINDLFSLHHNEDNRTSLKYDKIVPSPEYVAKNILKITKKIHHQCPETKIYVRTILPTRKDYLKQDISVVNNLIKQFEKKGYYKVIDLYPKFIDDNEEMIKELTKDGVHLNNDGYARWVETEKSIIEGL